MTLCHVANEQFHKDVSCRRDALTSLSATDTQGFIQELVIEETYFGQET